MNFKTLFISSSLIAIAHAGDFSSDDSLANTDCFCARPDSHAPIGVMGDHLHRKGEWMLSKRTSFMRMQQNFVGTNSISATQVRNLGFGIAPVDMDMQMRMLGLMYAPSDTVTLMAMVSYVEISMNHLYGPNLDRSFTTRSSGLGDASIGALISLWKEKHSSLHMGLTALLPTAKTDRRGFIPPAGGVRRLPYPMQLGSGSWGISPSLTYTSHLPTWSYGAQVSGKFLLDDNREGYRLGNRFEATTWIAKPLSEKFSTSLRLRFSQWGDIHGADPFIGGPVPTARPDLRGGSKLDLSTGINFFRPSRNFRVGLEVGKTIWQDLDGPQLGSDYWVNLGVQRSW